MAAESLTDRKAAQVPIFLGAQARHDGSAGEGCFSQWWEGHPFEVEGKTYRTAEHYMMAAKARLFGDAAREKRSCSHRVGGSEKMGPRGKGFSQAKWEAHRCEIVIQGNVHKFGQHEELRAFLLNTSKRVLVEASPADAIWGIGLSARDHGAANPHKWRGTNLLGFCLMEVRDRLREGE